MTLTPSSKVRSKLCFETFAFSFGYPEPPPFVSGVEEINLKPEESKVGLLPSPVAVGGLRGRNPLLVVSSVTPGGLFPK